MKILIVLFSFSILLGCATRKADTNVGNESPMRQFILGGLNAMEKGQWMNAYDLFLLSLDYGDDSDKCRLESEIAKVQMSEAMYQLALEQKQSIGNEGSIELAEKYLDLAEEAWAHTSKISQLRYELHVHCNLKIHP